MPTNRTDEAKLVHFAEATGWNRTAGTLDPRDDSPVLPMWVAPDGTKYLHLPDFALDEAQMGRVFHAVNKVADRYRAEVRHIRTAAPCDDNDRCSADIMGPDGAVVVYANTFQSAAFALVLAVTGYGDE